jgi:hypothetical protein
MSDVDAYDLAQLAAWMLLEAAEHKAKRERESHCPAVNGATIGASR